MTPRQEVSVASVSEVALRPDEAADLICPPDAIFDGDRIDRDLTAAMEGATDGRSRRGAVVPVLKTALSDGRAAIAEGVAARPLAAREAVRAYAYLTDCVIGRVFDLVTSKIHPNPTPTQGQRLAVLAVGGYGRGEMAPFSDVDLLFVTPLKANAWAESVVESMLYILWDLHLKVGHASRTIRECLRLGKGDFTIRTSLLETRFLTGDKGLADDLEVRLWNELFRGTEGEFIDAKLAERGERHEKQGGQRYVVEPNVKEGKGGLRDLQALYWIAKYVRGVNDVGDLVADGTFHADEHERFYAAETFLMAVRNQLHLIANRAMDQLTFDLQVEVAERLGYADEGGRRAVEHFMQDYFRHATRVGELTRILLTALEAEHTKEAPAIVRFLTRRKPVKAGYKMVHNRLTYASEEAFLKDPLNLLRIFEEALRTGYLLHPDAMRLIAANLHMIDEDLRRNPEATRIFLDLLLKHGNPERSIRRMNELGVLSAFIPEFAPIVAMMQFNMYHHYTVDEHTIQCIATLAKIEREELGRRAPRREPHPQARRQPARALHRASPPRYRQGPEGGPLDPRRPDRPQGRATARVQEGGRRDRRMARALSPAHV